MRPQRVGYNLVTEQQQGTYLLPIFGFSFIFNVLFYDEIKFYNLNVQFLRFVVSCFYWIEHMVPSSGHSMVSFAPESLCVHVFFLLLLLLIQCNGLHIFMNPSQIWGNEVIFRKDLKNKFFTFKCLPGIFMHVCVYV